MVDSVMFSCHVERAGVGRHLDQLRIIFQRKLWNDRVEEKQSEADPFGCPFGKGGRSRRGQAISATAEVTT